MAIATTPGSGSSGLVEGRAWAPWGLVLVFGISMVILGCMAIGSAFVTTLATVAVFGVLLMVAGCVHLVSAFTTRGKMLWLNLLSGVLYPILGLLMIEHPLGAAAGFTLMMAAAFMVGGMFRILAALVERFEGRGWVLVNGIVTLLLGIMIWRQWPESSLWVIGLFVGIDLLFAGWAFIMGAFALRALGRTS